MFRCPSSAYADKFREAQITGKQLEMINDQVLKDDLHIGMLLHRKCILKGIERLVPPPPAPAPPSFPAPAAAGSPFQPQARSGLASSFGLPSPGQLTKFVSLFCRCQANTFDGLLSEVSLSHFSLLSLPCCFGCVAS